MVFLRPVVMRDADDHEPALARPLRPDPRVPAGAAAAAQACCVPINEAPVLPPLPRLEDSVVPICRAAELARHGAADYAAGVAAAVDARIAQPSPAPPPASAPGS